MKRLISITLAVAFLVVFVAGCSNDSAIQQETNAAQVEQEMDNENIEVKKINKSKGNIDIDEVHEKMNDLDKEERPAMKREITREDN